MPRCCFKYHVIEMALFFLVFIWISVTYFMVVHTSSSSFRKDTHVKGGDKELFVKPSIKLEPKLLSRSQDVKVTADVRGNLGPIEVIKQANPGTNWIKDRWQAASDMHGTAIKGQHWVTLEFSSRSTINVSKVVIDWEAAYAKKFRIEGKQTDDGDWCILYDGNDNSQEFRRKVIETGQSPGVKFKMPLHVIHTIDLNDISEKCPSLRYLRLFINKSEMGWGVSIWQFDVYGTDSPIQ